MSGVTGYVKRTELSMSDLVLNNPPTYRIVDPNPGPGSLAWVRRVVTSPYVHGNTLVGAVKDEMEVALTVAVGGSTFTAIDAAVGTLIEAFSQFDYQLHLEFDGMPFTYNCQPANWTSSTRGDGSVDLADLRAGWQVYSFRIPRHPAAVAGSH